MTLVRTLRWNALGWLASLMIVVMWISVAGGATETGVTFRRYAGALVEAKRAGKRAGSSIALQTQVDPLRRLFGARTMPRQGRGLHTLSYTILEHDGVRIGHVETSPRPDFWSLAWPSAMTYGE